MENDLGKEIKNARTLSRGGFAKYTVMVIFFLINNKKF